MKKFEKYTGTKTYMFANGELASPEAVLARFPAAAYFAHIIETDTSGQMCFAVQNLAVMRDYYGVNSTLSDDDAITAIEVAANLPPIEDDTPTIEERIAAALELQNLLTMPEVM